MLTKFRIDFSDVIVITDITRKAADSTRIYFDGLVKRFLKSEDGKGTQSEYSFNDIISGSTSANMFPDVPEPRISESEMLALRDKNNRHMRLREQLLLHSKTSNLIVM